MRSCLFSVRDCSAGLGLPQTDQRAIRILWRTEPSPIPHSIRMARGWNVRLVSQITLHHTVWWLYFSKPLPARQESNRVELVALRYSPPKPFHQRTDMFKRLRYRQRSPWTLAHMGSRCHGSLTGGSLVVRELFTLRWGIQAVYETETGSDCLHTHSPTPSAWHSGTEVEHGQSTRSN